jgi:type IV secretory pathway VirB2 component (pilin)
MRNKPIQILLALALALFALSGRAQASTAGGGLPWESPLTTLSNSFSGPVPAAISLMAIVACVGVLMFGGELPFLARLLIYLVIGIATIVGGKNVMSGLGLTAAQIGEAKTEVYAPAAHSDSPGIHAP